MSDNLIHAGTRSWRDGSVKTKRGRKIPQAERLLFPGLSGLERCPVCERDTGE